jgi:alkylated DNA repair dioxygenase AlkB
MQYQEIVSEHGWVHYYPNTISFHNSVIQDLLQQVDFAQNSIRIYGRICKIPRREAWFGPGQYSYSGNVLKPQSWPSVLEQMKEQVEQTCGVSFNSCLLNYYHDGADYAAWHRDNEKELGPNPTIATVSIGASRRFMLRRYKVHHKKVTVDLSSGDLVVMGGRASAILGASVGQNQKRLWSQNQCFL